MFTEREIIKMFDTCRKGDDSFLPNNVESIIQFRDIEDRSFLDVAIACSHVDMIKTFLNIGFMSELDDFARASRFAVETGDMNLIKLLKGHVDSLQVIANEEYTLFLIASLLFASKFGHIDIVTYLLPDCPKEAVNAALLEAASESHLAIVRLLLYAGPNVHLDPSGSFFSKVVNTMFNPKRAPRDHDCDTLMALIDAGSVVNVREAFEHFGRRGTVPLLQRIFASYPPAEADFSRLLMTVITHNSLDVVKYCLGLAQERVSALPVTDWLNMALATSPQPGVVDYIIDEFNVDVNTLSADMYTGAPVDLSTAAQCSSVTMTQRLLADPRRSKVHSSMLSEAHDPAVLRLLLRDPAAIVWDRGQRYPVLKMASQKLNVESVKLLVAAGADPSEYTRFGSPLRYAIAAKCAPERMDDKIAVINTLLDAGAKTDDRLSLLYSFCQPSNGPGMGDGNAETILAALVSRRPELVRQRDSDGLTALLVLARDYPEQTRLMKMLIDAGADVHARDKHGESVASHLLTFNPRQLAREHQRARQSLQLLLASGVDPAECSSDGITLLMCAMHVSRPIRELSETDDRAGCMYIVDLVDAMTTRAEAGLRVV
jgi:ankyrin repeat protein